MPFFSVVLPIYNVEKYVGECIDSILEQDFKDFEVILVDDGSPDGSGKICDEYEKKDTRIKVIHKSNGGVSIARNAGVEAARGEWLIFVDSDDFFNEMSFFAKLYKTIKETYAEVVTYGTCSMRDKDKAIIQKIFAATNEMNELTSEAEKVAFLVEKDQLSISACLHACETAFIKQKALYFDESLKSEEDVEWFLRVLLSEPKMVGLAGTPYTYRIREDSYCTGKKKSGFWKRRYSTIEKTLNLIRNSSWDEKEKKSIYQYLAYAYYILLGEICDEPDVEVRRQALREIRKFDELQKYSAGKKVNLSRAVVRIFGISFGAKILNIYIHFRARQKGQPIIKE